MAVFLVCENAEGLEIGERAEKGGLKALPACEVVFNNVAVRTPPETTARLCEKRHSSQPFLYSRGFYEEHLRTLFGLVESLGSFPQVFVHATLKKRVRDLL